MRYLRFFIIFIFSAFLVTENIHANEYIAFSLKVAQQMILSTPQGKDYRKLHPEVFTLGGITAMNGLVYDRKTGDVILVGQRDPDRAILTLDDFVVALRARFIHGKWPLVSIDPTPETEKTQMQVVRFEGGIEDTQFGQDLFDADYCLKQIGMGLLPPGVPGLKSGWDLGMERAKQQTSKNYQIMSRFWFYPMLPNVSVREDVVAIKGLKVGVFTEVMSAEIDGKKPENPKTFQDTAGDEFARQVTDKFEALSNTHPSFSRVHGLDELVALVNAIENMEERPDLDWWLMKYEVKKAETQRKVEVLRRHEEYRIPVSGGYYDGHYEVSGGVQLMAIALRFKAGDVTALKEAALKTRPKSEALTWGFIVGDWIVPTSGETFKVDDIAVLFSHAVFLQNNDRLDESINFYEKIINLKPDWDWPYTNRGVALYKKGMLEEAIRDFDRALEKNPNSTLSSYNKGLVLVDIGKVDIAIKLFENILDKQPLDSAAWNAKGFALTKLEKYKDALHCFEKALEIEQDNSLIWSNKGFVLTMLAQYRESLMCFNKVLEINPADALSWRNKGAVLIRIGNNHAGIECLKKFLALSSSQEQIENINKVIGSIHGVWSKMY